MTECCFAVFVAIKMSDDLAQQEMTGNHDRFGF